MAFANGSLRHGESDCGLAYSSLAIISVITPFGRKAGGESAKDVAHCYYTGIQA